MTPKTSRSENAVRRAIQTGSGVFAAVILILLNMFCYRHTLGGYFLADDFVHVAYLSEVFNGHPFKLLENFTGNWMHAWGTQFYRPFITITLACDYLLGNGSAFCFHLSNTVFHFLAGFFLFLVTKRLMVDFSGKQAYFCALSASILFTVCPLHTEVVSWIIGRVDGVCLAAFLAAFYGYLRYCQEGGRAWLTAGIFGFVLSLLSKEMAVILPPLLVLTSLLLSSKQNIKTRILRALKESAVFWLVLAVYFGVRSSALGTFTGGYGGSLGEGLSGSAIERFKSAVKILFPFNAEVITPFDRLRKQLSTLYYAAGIFAFIRLVLFGGAQKQLKLGLFCLGWFLLALLPTYQVFNITDSLMCSRFAYFATAPFCILLALLISPCWELPRLKSGPLNKWLADRKTVLSRWTARISVVLLACFTIVLAGITLKNNDSWAHAGRQVRLFREALAARCGSLPPQGKLVLLNVPQRLEGAHMIYNGAMLYVLLSEPLSRPAIAGRVLSFEPPTYGEAEFINVSRLRHLLATHPEYTYCYWDMADQRLLELNLSSQPCQRDYDMKALNEQVANQQSSDKLAILSPPLSLNAVSVDFVVCDLCLSKKKNEAGFLTLYWSSSQFPSFSPARSISLPLKLDGSRHRYYFPVSERKSWIAGQRIERLKLQLSPGWSRLETSSNKQELNPFQSLQIISAEEIMPELSPAPDQLAEGLDGIDRLVADHFELSCDASRIPGCTRIILELSRPNCWFEHYAGTYRDRRLSDQSLTSWQKPGNKARFQITRKDFPQPAYYELRAFALDKNGSPIGFCSDPIDLQID